MVDRDKERRRLRWPFDDDDDPLGGDIDDIFEEMRRRMERMMEGALRGVEPGKPFMYGYSLRVGPDGKPEFQEFGDTHLLKPGPRSEEGAGRRPVTDVIERDDGLSITLELPGVNKEDIDMRVTEDKLTVKVENPERRYYKEIDLGGGVDPNSIKATFKNGILDVNLRRVGGPRGKKVKID